MKTKNKQENIKKGLSSGESEIPIFKQREKNRIFI